MTMPNGPDIKSIKPYTRRGFLVAEVSVEGLFGQYNYRISPLSSAAAKRGAPQLMLLYGENGSGKTTVLRILWHLLSPAEGRQHRSRLAEIPFMRVEVRLGGGDLITIQKKEGLTGDYRIVVRRAKEELLTQDYAYNPATQSVDAIRPGFITASITGQTIQSGQLNFPLVYDTNVLNVASTTPHFWAPKDEYVSYLATLETQPFFMADDRQLHSDQIDENIRAQRMSAYRRETDGDSFVAALELANAISNASNQLGRQLLTGSATGQQSIDQVYIDVLTQLGRSDPDEHAIQSVDAIRSALIDLAKRAESFYEFGIVPRIPANAFIRLIDKMDKPRQDLASRILGLYIEGQNARLDSLQDAERLIRTFVVNIQKYLSPRKSVTFTPTRGLTISDQNNDRLRPDQLSSGERQLLLLLCNSLLARQSTGLFLIDEPELSLNSTWQRELVGSLLEIVAGANVQFIIATHSIQIISRYDQYLTELRPVSE
jgi:ABC-type lipoprotein export system ATPase subunit